MKSVKTRNAFKKLVPGLFPNLVFNLKNSNHPEEDGCSGFITNTENDKIIYIDTRTSVYGPLQDKIMFREAKSTKDFRGKTNQWSPRKNDEWILVVAGNLI